MQDITNVASHPASPAANDLPDVPHAVASSPAPGGCYDARLIKRSLRFSRGETTCDGPQPFRPSSFRATDVSSNSTDTSAISAQSNVTDVPNENDLVDDDTIGNARQRPSVVGTQQGGIPERPVGPISQRMWEATAAAAAADDDAAKDAKASAVVEDRSRAAVDDNTTQIATPVDLADANSVVNITDGTIARAITDVLEVDSSSDDNNEDDDAEWKPRDRKALHRNARRARRSSIVTTVLDAAETIKVYARMRPLSTEEQDAGYSSCVTVHHSGMDGQPPRRVEITAAAPNGTQKGSEFTFAEVFPSSTTQLQVFNSTALPLVRRLFRGENALLFAYGMTNAGKTYTIQGTSGPTADNEGIIPRAMHLIFASIASAGHPERPGAIFNRPEDTHVGDLMSRVSPETRSALEGEIRRKRDNDVDGFPSTMPLEDFYRYRVTVSYLEIYNEQCFDLLEEVKSNDAGELTDIRATKKRALTKKKPKKRAILRLKEDAQGKPFIDGLTQTTVRSVEDVDLIVAIGAHNRRVAETMANNNSSRSHTVFAITLERYDTRQENPTPTYSKFSIVDLAGSERTSRTQATGAQLREAAAINKSLMNLSRCLEVLRENQKTLAAGRKRVNIVPYRQSKLTRLFQENFEAGSAVMITAVSPCSRDADETIHGLRCSVVAQQVKVTNFNSESAREAVMSKAGHNQPEDNAMIGEKQLVGVQRLLVEQKRRTAELERENCDLREKLADAESRVFMVEAEVRDEAAEQMRREMERQASEHAKQMAAVLQANELSTATRVALITKTSRKAIRESVMSTRRTKTAAGRERNQSDDDIEEITGRLAAQKLDFGSPKGEEEPVTGAPGFSLECERVTQDCFLDDTLNFDDDSPPISPV